MGTVKPAQLPQSPGGSDRLHREPPWQLGPTPSLAISIDKQEAGRMARGRRRFTESLEHDGLPVTATRHRVADHRD